MRSNTSRHALSAAVFAGAFVASCHEGPARSSALGDLPTPPSSSVANEVSSIDASTDASPLTAKGDPTDAAVDVRATWNATPKEPLYVGRFVETSRGHGCGWSGCEIRLRFRGTGVKARMDTGWANRFRVRIDQDAKTDTVLKGKSGEDTYVLAHDLPPGEHALSIVRLTEAGFGEWHVQSMAVDEGEVLAREEPPLRRIEFIGDSITCGAGNTGPSATCPLDQNTEDSTQSYAGLTADLLHASYTNLCYSGRGVYRDAKGFTSHPMTLLWKRTFVQRRELPWNPEALVPDVVVVNLGTNDTALSYERDKYVSAQASFYKTLRKVYPSAHLVYAVGARKTTANVQQARADLARFVASLGKGSNVSFLTWEAAAPDERDGCAFHPGLLSHERMAASLAAHLRTELHW